MRFLISIVFVGVLMLSSTVQAGKWTHGNQVFYDGIEAEHILITGKILAKHVSKGERSRDPIVVFYSVVKEDRVFVCKQWDIDVTCSYRDHR